MVYGVAHVSNWQQHNERKKITKIKKNIKENPMLKINNCPEKEENNDKYRFSCIFEETKTDTSSHTHSFMVV